LNILVSRLKHDTHRDIILIDYRRGVVNVIKLEFLFVIMKEILKLVYNLHYYQKYTSALAFWRDTLGLYGDGHDDDDDGRGGGDDDDVDDGCGGVRSKSTYTLLHGRRI